MPLYMDRHFLHGVNAESVSKAHQADIAHQSKFGCQALTYWFDESSGTAFCLIDAPNKKAVKELHKSTHGLIPNEIIEVDGNFVELFLGRLTDPKSSKNNEEFERVINESGFRTLMYIDYRFDPNSGQDINRILEYRILKKRNDIIRKALRKNRGREVIEQTDGGFMASFLSAIDSVKSAIEIQKSIGKLNQYENGINMNIGIGLYTGAPVSKGKEIFENSIKQVHRFFNVAKESEVVVPFSIGDIIKKENNKLLSNNIRIIDNSDEKFLTKLLDIIETRFNDENLVITELGREVGLSNPQLYRKIKELTGYSPNRFLRDYRLDKALKLVREQHGNISEIGYECGFGSPSYFSKCFQIKFGILPSQIAKSSS